MSLRLSLQNVNRIGEDKMGTNLYHCRIIPKVMLQGLYVIESISYTEHLVELQVVEQHGGVCNFLICCAQR
jgi:hypothetical protein